MAKGSWSSTAALMKGAEGDCHAYVTHTTNTHTRTHINQSSLHSALFGLFIWIQEKGKGLCIPHCAQKGSHTGPEPGGVSPPREVCVCVCRTVYLHLSFLLSLSLFSVIVWQIYKSYQQEGRGTDNELNRGSLSCRKQVENWLLNGQLDNVTV